MELIFLVIWAPISSFLNTASYKLSHAFSPNCTKNYCFKIGQKNQFPSYLEITPSVETKVPVLILEEDDSEKCKKSHLVNVVTKKTIILHTFKKIFLGDYNQKDCTIKFSILPSNTKLTIDQVITLESKFRIMGGTMVDDHIFIVSDKNNNRYEISQQHYNFLKDEMHNSIPDKPYWPKYLNEFINGTSWEKLISKTYRICQTDNFEEIREAIKINFKTKTTKDPYGASCTLVEFDSPNEFQKALVFYDVRD